MKRPVLLTTFSFLVTLPMVADENPLQEICSAFVSHDCEMVVPPAPEYPKLAELGEADCFVTFRIEPDYTVAVTKVACSDDRFAASAAESMSTVRYKARDVCDRACPTVGQEHESLIAYRLSE